MASGEIALVREQGVNFGVVCVADHIVENPHERDQQVRAWSVQLGVPAVLMGANRHRTYGRKDIVGWLETVDHRCLPWRRVTF